MATIEIAEFLMPSTYTLRMFLNADTLAGMAQTETQGIARGLRQRDVECVRGLVEQYQYRLVRYFIFLLGRRDLVEDLVQETWLRVLERGRSYDGQSRFEPWLFTIARNLAIDHLRKRQIYSLDTSLDTSLDKRLGTNDAANSEPKALRAVSLAPSPFEQAARTEDAQRLAGSLATLEPIYREALVLRFQEDLSLKEMADVTGVSVSTVSSRIYRGLAALRANMEGGADAS